MSTTGKETGIILLLTSLICLGKWPALLRLCTNTTSTKASTLQQQHDNSAHDNDNSEIKSIVITQFQMIPGQQND
eukprot:10775566-Ditylum_brightwellii.AAC.1